jgi:N-acetylglucosaminyldiphosphoundecaprenol N-acetyl-beta-D-mannosaminyltransferase
VARTESELILGYSVYAGGVAGCVDSIAEWILRGGRARWLACLNPHSYVAALDSPNFCAALQSADWVIPDGIGIVLASRLRDGAIRERVTGSDVFLGLSARLNEVGGVRYFFLGATEATLASIRQRLAADFPGILVAGAFAPSFSHKFSDEEIDQMVARINEARPDVLWVGMTAPKQELWIHSVLERLDVRFVAAVGAVFDFYTGRIKRSHPLFRQFGLEWLPRLVQEPRRLWRRTFVSAPVFMWHVLRRRRPPHFST